MKNHKNEKNTTTVVTPNPPQDMDPSTHPEQKNKKKASEKQNKATLADELENKKLAPREEL